MNHAETVFDRIGGAATVDKFIQKFYRAVLGDPELAPFFRDTDIPAQIESQKMFMTMALGGPVLRTDFDLAAVHAGRGIQRHHLERFTSHLVDAMKGSDINSHDIDEIVSRIATWSTVVLGESGGVDG